MQENAEDNSIRTYFLFRVTVIIDLANVIYYLKMEQVFHLLFNLCDIGVMLSEPLVFLHIVDIGTLHLPHQLLLVLLVRSTPNGSKSPNLHTVCLCDTVCLLKFSTNFDKEYQMAANS